MNISKYETDAYQLVENYKKAFEISFLESLVVMGKKAQGAIYVYNIYICSERPDYCYAFNTTDEFNGWCNHNKEIIKKEFSLGLGSERYNPAVYENLEFYYSSKDCEDLCEQIEAVYNDIYNLTDDYSDKAYGAESIESKRLKTLYNSMKEKIRSNARDILQKHYCEFSKYNLDVNFLAFLTGAEFSKEDNIEEVKLIIGEKPMKKLFPDIEKEYIERQGYLDANDKDKISHCELAIMDALKETDPILRFEKGNAIFKTLDDLSDLRPHADELLIKWVNKYGPKVEFCIKGSKEFETFGAHNLASNLIDYIMLIIEKKPFPNKKLELAIKASLEALHEKYYKSNHGVIPVTIDLMAESLHVLNPSKYPIPQRDSATNRTLNIKDFVALDH